MPEQRLMYRLVQAALDKYEGNKVKACRYLRQQYERYCNKLFRVQDSMTYDSWRKISREYWDAWYNLDQELETSYWDGY